MPCISAKVKIGKQLKHNRLLGAIINYLFGLGYSVLVSRMPSPFTSETLIPKSKFNSYNNVNRPEPTWYLAQ